ncbi:hypothetical protein ACFWDG_20020 [Peribacillus sp. NPDC060186]
MDSLQLCAVVSVPVFVRKTNQLGKNDVQFNGDVRMKRESAIP